MAECVHGMDQAWCGYCTTAATESGTSQPTPVPAGGVTKQEMLDRICDQLSISRRAVGVGSSIPAELFDELRTRFALPSGPMPEVAAACVLKAGLDWSPDFDSRSTLSGGGSTVTLAGLIALSKAVATLQRGSA
jgi:hypothetical protein